MSMKKMCKGCSVEFETGRSRQVYCSQNCKDKHRTPVVGVAHNCSTATAGAAIEMVVASQLMLEGWHVYKACSPNGPVDLIAHKGDQVRYLECRAGIVNKSGELKCPTQFRAGMPRPTEFAVFHPVSHTVHYFNIIPTISVQSDPRSHEDEIGAVMRNAASPPEFGPQCLGEV